MHAISYLPRKQKRVSIPLELELRMIVIQHVDGKNQTQFYAKHQVLYTMDPSLQPQAPSMEWYDILLKKYTTTLQL